MSIEELKNNSTFARISEVNRKLKDLKNMLMINEYSNKKMDETYRDD
jgi:uncharacterized protein YaaR (DUF327 family)